MTEPRAAAAALPLAVTYAPDGRLVDAVRALVARVGALAGDPPHAQPFAAAVQEVVTWVTEHRAAIDGDVLMRFERVGDRLYGDLHWAAAGATPGVPPVRGAASPDVDVACDVSGAEVRCRVSCRCA
jgi:hypothetical protein